MILLRRLYSFFVILFLFTSFQLLLLSHAIAIDYSKVLQFSTHGWTLLRNLLPELKQAVLQDHIIHDIFSKTQLQYLIYANYYLQKEYQFNSSTYQSECGTLDIHNYMQLIFHHQQQQDKESQNKNKKEYEHGFAILKCCIAKYNSLLDDRSQFAKFPYFQSLNPHRFSDQIYHLAVQESLGYYASELLQVDKVRLYQTALFQKSNKTLNEGTDWHKDLGLVPLDTNKYLTFWCPVKHSLSSKRDDSLLRFATGSHRDKTLYHWYPSKNVPNEQRNRIINDRYPLAMVSSLEAGDCTAHHGWIYHCATPQPEHNQERFAIGFSFVAEDSRVLHDLAGTGTRQHRPLPSEDEMSYSFWYHDLAPKSKLVHPLIPLVYEKGKVIDYSIEKTEASDLFRKKFEEIVHEKFHHNSQHDDL